MTKTRDLADLGGGFIQAGSGAVQRTVESKLQDVVSVKDFGAVGDWNGSSGTDDYPAFAAALASGKPVYVPKGRYRLNTTLSITGNGASLLCEPGVVMNYLGNGAAMTLSGSNHNIRLGELTSQNGTKVIAFWNFEYSTVEADTLGVASQAIIYHDAGLQSQNAGNCIFRVRNISAGNCQYGVQIPSHATYTLEGCLFDVKVLFSATSVAASIGTNGNNTVRWNRFVLAPDGQGITPLLLDIYNDSNSFYIQEWQGETLSNPSALHVRFNTGVVRSYLFASPGVQNKLLITDNGSNFAIYPHENGYYRISQGQNHLTLDDNSVGGHIIANGAFRISTGGDERIRWGSDGTLTSNNLPAFFTRAWVSFGVAGGTLSTQAAGNCSISRITTGEFQVTFTTPMPDASYAISGTCMYTGAWIGVVVKPASKTVNGFTFFTSPPGAASVDPSEAYISVVR